LPEDILLAVCALLNLCFLQGTGYVPSTGKKAKWSWPTLTQCFRILRFIGQQEKFQVAICKLQFENESRSLPHTTQHHDFRLLGMSHCLFHDSVCSSGMRCRTVGRSLKKKTVGKYM